MGPYLYSLPDFKEIFKTSHVLFDSSAIIDIVKFESQNLVNEMREIGSIPCYTHEVLLEIYRSENLADRTRRQLFLAQYQFQPLPHIEKNAKKEALELQKELHKYSCHPAPTDILLGSCLNVVHSGLKVYLLTSNIKDFPEPVYKRVGYLILQSNKEARILGIIAHPNQEDGSSGSEEIPF